MYVYIEKANEHICTHKHTYMYTHTHTMSNVVVSETVLFVINFSAHCFLLKVVAFYSH